MSKRGKRRQRRQKTRKTTRPKNYRTQRYIEYIFHAEIGILQASKVLPELTDGEVLDALRKLGTRVRSGGLPHY